MKSQQSREQKLTKLNHDMSKFSYSIVTTTANGALATHATNVKNRFKALKLFGIAKETPLASTPKKFDLQTLMDYLDSAFDTNADLVIVPGESLTSNQTSAYTQNQIAKLDKQYKSNNVLQFKIDDLGTQLSDKEARLLFAQQMATLVGLSIRGVGHEFIESISDGVQRTLQYFGLAKKDQDRQKQAQEYLTKKATELDAKTNQVIPLQLVLQQLFTISKDVNHKEYRLASDALNILQTKANNVAKMNILHRIFAKVTGYNSRATFYKTKIPKNYVARYNEILKDAAAINQQQLDNNQDKPNQITIEEINLRWQQLNQEVAAWRTMTKGSSKFNQGLNKLEFALDPFTTAAEAQRLAATKVKANMLTTIMQTITNSYDYLKAIISQVVQDAKMGLGFSVKTTAIEDNEVIEEQGKEQNAEQVEENSHDKDKKAVDNTQYLKQRMQEIKEAVRERAMTAKAHAAKTMANGTSNFSSKLSSARKTAHDIGNKMNQERKKVYNKVSLSFNKFFVANKSVNQTDKNDNNHNLKQD